MASASPAPPRPQLPPLFNLALERLLRRDAFNRTSAQVTALAFDPTNASCSVRAARLHFLVLRVIALLRDPAFRRRCPAPSPIDPWLSLLDPLATSTESLDLSRTNASLLPSKVPALSRLAPRLMALDCGGAAAIEDASLAHLTACPLPALQFLNLSGTRVTDEGVIFALSERGGGAAEEKGSAADRLPRLATLGLRCRGVSLEARRRGQREWSPRFCSPLLLFIVAV